MVNKLRNSETFIWFIKHEEDVDKFCNNDSCEIVPMTGDNDDQDYELNLQKRTDDTDVKNVSIS